MKNEHEYERWNVFASMQFLKWEIIRIPRTKHKKKRKNVENLAQVQWPIEVSVCEYLSVWMLPQATKPNLKFHKCHFGFYIE